MFTIIVLIANQADQWIYPYRS